MIKRTLISMWLLALFGLAAAHEGHGEKKTEAKPRPLKLVITPKDGAKDVSPGTNIWFKFNRSVRHLTVTLKDEEGQVVEGKLMFITRTRRAVFDPFGDEPPYRYDRRLKMKTHYTVQVEADGKTFKSSFTTNDVGSSVKKELKGNTYRLDLKEVLIAEPPGLQNLIASAGRGFDYPAVFLEVLDQLQREKSEYLKMAVSYEVPDIEAKAEEGEKPPMRKERTVLPEFAFNNPFFQLGPLDLRFQVLKRTITLQQALIGGVFSRDGERMEEVEIEGVLDLREGVKAAGDDPSIDPEQIRQMVEGMLGQKLRSCDDGQTFCLPFRLTQIRGMLYKK